ncbi:MAG: Fic family protein [Victivallaceae bacterium]
MRDFDYDELPATLLTPEISGQLSAIHEHRGRQVLYLSARQDILHALLDVALIQSTDASNRIEGIFTSDARLKALVEQTVEPRTRSEREIAGYRDVLATIHEHYPHLPVTPNLILQLHRDLYSYLAPGIGGHWKNGDKVISETDPSGKRRIRFKPLSAMETPEAMSRLCSAYRHAVDSGRHDPLLLSGIFVFDFLSIHPFDDGNGRMSRLLTLLLLYQAGYLVGKYISIEMFIEKSKQTYYEMLQASSLNWGEARGDYRPFICYYLGIILKSCREFEDRVGHLLAANPTKAERIRMFFEQKPGAFAKREILAFCPDISVAMVEKTLKSLLDAGVIRKLGAGKNTVYAKR